MIYILQQNHLGSESVVEAELEKMSSVFQRFKMSYKPFITRIARH